jgi:1-deoxy-D-xylulose-5-phosphate synthase
MEDGTGLARFARMYPKQFFDVGIAEEHAVTFAGGLAAGGAKPVFAVYSSFLQRAYDQLVHDICMQKLPVVFAIDRAGLVGNDGETHQGVFDVSFLNTIPNMTVMAPKHKWELADMLRFAIEYDGPIALRYPRGAAYDGFQEYRAPIMYGKSEIISEGKEIAILSVGHMFEEAAKVSENLKDLVFDHSLVNVRFTKPIDEEMLDELVKEHKLIVTIEENVQTGGYGEKVLEYVSRKGYDVKVLILALPDQYIEHGNISVLREETGIDSQSMTERIIKTYKEL